MMELQPMPKPTYTLEEIHQLLLVLEQIQNLSLRPEQTEQMAGLIEQIARLMSSRSFPVPLSPELQEQVQSILESLTPDEVDRIDEAIGQPKIEVAILTHQQLQQVLSVLEGIASLNLRPQQTQLIQFLLQQLQPLLAEGRPEVLLKTGQALQIQAIVNSLTDEEQERIQEIMPSLEPVYRLTQAELQDFLSILRDLKDFPENPDIAQIAEALLPELEQLQAQGEPEIELHGIYAAQIQTILQQLMPV
jgi:hypothetical protein